jgi:hypothetical protein
MRRSIVSTSIPPSRRTRTATVPLYIFGRMFENGRQAFCSGFGTPREPNERINRGRLDAPCFRGDLH